MPIRWRGLKPPRLGAGAALPLVRAGVFFATVTGSGFFADLPSFVSFLAGVAALLRVARARRAAAASVVSSFLPPKVEKKPGRFLIGGSSAALLMASICASISAWVEMPLVSFSCVASPDSWSVVSPVTRTGRLRSLRLLRLLLVGLPAVGGTPLFCSELMTDLHWIHDTLQRDAARYPVTIHARFQDTYYSRIAGRKRSPATMTTLEQELKRALASMDRRALAVVRAAEKGDRRERQATGRW